MDICDWLLDKADAPIRYRVAREFLKDASAAKKIEGELLENDTVKRWLRNLKPESPPQHWSMEHGSFDFCMENAALKCAQLGMHAGLPQMADAASAYLDKMAAATKASKASKASKALSAAGQPPAPALRSPTPVAGQPPGPASAAGQPPAPALPGPAPPAPAPSAAGQPPASALPVPAPSARLYRSNLAFALASANFGFYTILIANVLTLAGFEDAAIRAYMLGSLDELNAFAVNGDYDIYADAAERQGLKAVPQVWKDRKFIKRGLVEKYGFCYPLVYDIIGLHKLYGAVNPETDGKIDAIIAYISTDEFHDAVADGYGILISGDNKYHSMGWDPKYPGWHDPAEYMENRYPAKLLFFAQHIAKYPAARKTKWFSSLLEYLGKYDAGGGIYKFPAGWLKESRGYAVQGSHISFGEDRKKRNWREIESTFYMQDIMRV